MHPKLEIHVYNLPDRLSSISRWRISPRDKIDLRKFADELKLGRINKGRKLADRRIIKYLYTLKVPLEYFKKPVTSLTLKDVEKFERNLSSGKIKSTRGSPFSISTQSDIRSILRIYLRWRLKSRASRLVDWFDTRVPRKTPDYLSEDEIHKLFKACKSPEERFLIAVLFDSGARASEFHNIRFGDVEVPSASSPYVRLTFKEEYSKTKGRTVSLYWENSHDAVLDYVKDRVLRPSDPVFSLSYDNARQFLHRLGKKVLGRSIHYHLFRHSSATYYANKLNRQELCYRYGWKFSSDMPDVYISRSGMMNNDIDKRFEGSKIKELEQDLSRVKQMLNILIEKSLTTTEKASKTIAKYKKLLNTQTTTI